MYSGGVTILTQAELKWVRVQAGRQLEGNGQAEAVGGPAVLWEGGARGGDYTTAGKESPREETWQALEQSGLESRTAFTRSY